MCFFLAHCSTFAHIIESVITQSAKQLSIPGKYSRYVPIDIYVHTVEKSR